VTGWFAPGRLEVLGKHTDYAGGRSLLAAVDRGVRVEARDANVGVTAQSDAFPEPIHLLPGVEPDLPDGHWGHYLQTVVDRLTSNFGPLPPTHLDITSDLPLASGMSSSSALLVASALTLADRGGFLTSDAWQANIHEDADLAGYLACVENGMSFGSLAGHRGVGTFGGSEDHTAMLCCRPGELSVFSFCPVRRERQVVLPDDLRFVVAVSGVLAEKTGSARERYNRASRACVEIVRTWNTETGRADVTIADAVASAHDASERLRALVATSDDLSTRLHQFLVESNHVIPEAADALAAGHLDRFGDLVDASMHLATTHLGNQVGETVDLARLARELGASAASAFGAGFGGSVWALVSASDADAFAEHWLRAYRAAHPEVGANASTLVTRPGGPAQPL